MDEKQARLQRTRRPLSAGAAPSPDLLVDGTNQGLAYLGRHRGAVLGAIAAVALLGGGVATLLTQRANTARAASVAFARALSLLERPTDEDRAQLAEARRARDVQLAEADAEAQAPAKRPGPDAAAPDNDNDNDDAEDDVALDADGANAGGERGKLSPAERRAAQRRAEVQAEAAEEQEANRQKIPRFATRKEREAAGYRALLEVWTRWPKQPVAALAALQGANVAALAGEQATADATYAALYAKLSPESVAWPVVAARHAQAQRRAGDLDGAAATLQRVARSEHRLLADEAALERAYLLEERGERAQAEGELQELALKFPDSSLQDEVRAELAALAAESPASEGAAPGTSPQAPAAAAATPPAGAGPMPTPAAK